MIIEIRAKNCYVFEDEITFSMKADMRNKKFGEYSTISRPPCTLEKPT